MIPINNNRIYYKELFMEKCLLTKLLTFLEDKERCLAAGYTHYENYRRDSGFLLHQIIILGYNRIEKENIKVDITYSKDQPIYWIYATCIGDRPLKYMRSIIKTFCSGKETFAMKTIMKLSTALCVLINTKIVCNTASINKFEDKFMLKVLDNMRMMPEETQLFPTVDTDGMYNFKNFTLENLYMTNKVFDAIIEGITHNI